MKIRQPFLIEQAAALYRKSPLRSLRLPEHSLVVNTLYTENESTNWNKTLELRANGSPFKCKAFKEMPKCRYFYWRNSQTVDGSFVSFNT